MKSKERKNTKIEEKKEKIAKRMGKVDFEGQKSYKEEFSK